jgi:pimeloyl-ACP methyl ester carboxylesterase
MTKPHVRDVVVLVPGILGSVLEQNGREVWAPSARAAVGALWSLGRSITTLRLAADPVDVDDLGDGVVATRLVPDLHIVPGLWGIDGYSSVRDVLLDKLDLVRGHTYLEFPYDWRRDNRASARRLKAFVEPVLARVREDDPDAKLILVGHSMGGLVARWYLEQLGGWEHTKALVTFGTPHRGSLNALNFVANGFAKKVGPLKIIDLSELLCSCTSVYQLLPVYPCIDDGSGEVRRIVETHGIPNLDLARATEARTDFHEAIEAAARNRLGAYEVHPVVGLTQHTSQGALLQGGRLEVRPARPKVTDGVVAWLDESGDGTVPRVSATPLSLGDRPPAVYASERHSSLQATGDVQNQLLGLLTQVEDLDQLRDVRSGLGLDVDDIYDVGEPISLEVTAEGTGLDLVATVEDVSRRRIVGSFPLERTDDLTHRRELRPLEPGSYRVTITGLDESSEQASPVTDVFIVANDNPPTGPGTTEE